MTIPFPGSDPSALRKKVESMRSMALCVKSCPEVWSCLRRFSPYLFLVDQRVAPADRLVFDIRHHEKEGTHVPGSVLQVPDCEVRLACFPARLNLFSLGMDHYLAADAVRWWFSRDTPSPQRSRTYRRSFSTDNPRGVGSRSRRPLSVGRGYGRRVSLQVECRLLLQP